MTSLTVSYAQNKEDIVLASFLRDIKKGFYVDIGANHPIDDSVTKLFYDKGWNGINIEPLPVMYSLLKEHRPRDINLNIGVGEVPGRMILREYSNHGLSTLSEHVKTNYLHKKNVKTDEYVDIKIRVEKVSSVLKKHGVQVIDFMKIDVEGFEYEVLKGNDWTKYRPKVICIESNHIVKDWRSLLDEANYGLAYNDGINDYYISHEEKARLYRFDYSRDMILDTRIVTPYVKSLIDRVAEMDDVYPSHASSYSEMYDELTSLKSKYSFIAERAYQLDIIISKYATIRSTLKELHDRMLRGLLIRAESLNTRRISEADELVFDTNQGVDSILQRCREYDKKHLREEYVLGGIYERYASKAIIFIIKASFKCMRVGARLAVKLMRVGK
jgi:FkbM family methyltransferase